jgi:hypothetical protein
LLQKNRSSCKSISIANFIQRVKADWPTHPSLMQMDEIALVLAALPWPLKEVEMVASNSGAANAMESQS